MRRLRRWWLFNRMYFGNPPWDTGVTPPELVEFGASHPPGRALDLGCGTGTNVLYLARLGWNVLGIDFAPKPVLQARRRARAAGLAKRAEFRVGDVSALRGVSGPFDLVLDIGCFHSLTPAGMDGYAQGVARVLRPGGTFLIYVHLQPDAGGRGVGVREADLLRFDPHLVLAQRADSHDRTRGRPSAWLRYERR